MSWPSRIESVQVEIIGGPLDGGIVIVPKAGDGTYGSIFGATPGLWPGLPIHQREDGTYLLRWEDVELQARVYEEGKIVIEEFMRMMSNRATRPTWYD